MKILAGASSLEEIKYFLAHGASEVYCGFSQIGNHRPPDACFLDIAEIFEAIDMAHSFNKKIFLAANETYHPDQYLSIDRHLEQMFCRGLDGVIVKDFLFLSHLNHVGLKTKFVLSSLAQCFNLQALQFYRQYNISRVVIPQHMLAREAKDLVLNKFHIGTEIFFIPNYCCINVDGMCGRFHDYFSSFEPCKMRYKRGDEDFLMPARPKALLMGVFYDFYKIGVPYLKLPRSSYGIDPESSFQLALDLLALLRQKDMTRTKFIAKALLIFKFKERIESWKKHCYCKK
jgi:hypothetical protein